MELANFLIELLGGYTAIDYKELKADLINAQAEINSERIKVQEIKDELSKYKLKTYPHNSIAEFKSYLEANLKKTTRYHNTSMGKIYPAIFIRTNKATDEMFDKYIKDNFSDLDSYHSDLIVQIITRFIHNLVKINGYSSDLKRTGKIEDWYSPEDAFELILTQNGSGDCEDYGILLYTLLRRALIITGFSGELWRLRCFLVNVIGSGYHFSVAWAKESCADWINLETTFYADSFDDVWSKDIPLRNNWLYQIDYSFDTETCYEKI